MARSRVSIYGINLGALGIGFTIQIYIYICDIYIYMVLPPPKDPRFSVCFELFVCNPCLFVLHVVCMSVFPREYPNI